MARKDRAPTPPKRVQAPQQRRTPQSPEAVRKQKLIVYGIAASGVLALGVVLLLVAFGGGGGGGDARAALEDAGCTLVNVPGVTNSSDHSDVPTPTTKVTWNTDPPSNGEHYGTTIIFGAYNEPLQQQLLVHNYEHGGVGIQYGSGVSQETIDQLRSFYDEDPDGLILAPYPKLGNKIALTAWTAKPQLPGKKGTGHVAKCTRFDEKAFSAFLDAYGFDGPEPFPRNALQPGGN